MEISAMLMKQSFRELEKREFGYNRHKLRGKNENTA